jgi:CelD/BcsL family acetyltransferase involved in cellulose biosynthesis
VKEAALPDPKPLGLPRLRVRFVTDLGDIEHLRPAWLEMEKAPTDHGAAFFQSFAWCVYVARLRVKLSPERYGVLVAVVEDDAGVMGLWPLSLQRSSKMWAVRNLDDPFGQFAGFLCRRTDWIEPCVQAVLDALRHQALADAVCIDSVIEGSPLHCALIAAGAKTGSSNEIVQVDMRESATFADYQRTLNSKTRKNLRNSMNRLRSAHGEVTDVVLDDSAQLGPIVKQTFDGRVDWMQRHGKSTNAFRDSDFRPLVEGLCAEPSLSLLGFQMHAFGEPIAGQWGFVYEGRYYAYISAREVGFDEFSPGRLHLGSVIAACKERGLDILELMAPAARYKLMWTDRAIGIHDMWMSVTMRGTVTLGVLEVVMPGVRSLARSLPKGLKRRLARRVNSE